MKNVLTEKQILVIKSVSNFVSAIESQDGWVGKMSELFPKVKRTVSRSKSTQAVFPNASSSFGAIVRNIPMNVWARNGVKISYTRSRGTNYIRVIAK
jgi:hypothetical protein